MLQVPLKSARPVDLVKPLDSYIKRKHDKSEAKKHHAALVALQELRDKVREVSSSSEESRHLLARYYAQLCYAESRFPMNETNIRIAFCWTDAFRGSKATTLCSSKFERACVLFNYGAMSSQTGAVVERTDEAGIKNAARHFMEAAGIFQFLNDELSPEIFGAKPPELCSEVLQALVDTMLGQAQACFFEKAMREKMPPSVLARLAMQAHLYFKRAHSSCVSGVAKPCLGSRWRDHLLMQSLSFRSSAEYWQASGDRAQADKARTGYGVEIARLRVAMAHCQEALAKARSVTAEPSIVNVIEHLHAKLSQRKEAAEQDNNTVYMEVVPEPDTLPDIKPAPMAKPMPMPNFTEVAGQDLFKDFIPVEVYEAANSHRDLATALLTETRHLVNTRADEIRKKLAAAGLPAAIEADATRAGLPDALWNRIKEVQGRGGVAALSGTMDECSKLRKHVVETLGACRRSLDEEERADNECRESHRERWTRMGSRDLNAQMRSDVNRYIDLLKQAERSDEAVGRKITDHWDAMGRLQLPREEVAASVPSAVTTEESGPAVAERNELARLLGAMNDLLLARDELVKELEGQVSHSDVAKELMMKGLERKDEVFAERTERYNGVRERVAELCTREEKIMEEIMGINERFQAARESSEEMRAREQALQELQNAVDKFLEADGNLREGARFYADLQQRARQLHQTISDFVFTRNVEKSDLEETIKHMDASRAHAASDEAYARQLAGGAAAPGAGHASSASASSYPGFQGYPASSASPAGPSAGGPGYGAPAASSVPYAYSVPPSGYQSQPPFPGATGYPGGAPPAYGAAPGYPGAPGYGGPAYGVGGGHQAYGHPAPPPPPRTSSAAPGGPPVGAFPPRGPPPGYPGAGHR